MKKCQNGRNNIVDTGFNSDPKLETAFYYFLIALAIFILGVQIGIKHGRDLQIEDFQIQYGYYIPD